MSDVTVPPVAETVPPAAPVFDPQAAISALAERNYQVFSNDFKFDPAQQTDNPVIKNIVGATTSRFYETEDAEIFAATGIPKNQGEKTYAYRNRTYAELQEKIQKAPDVESIKTEYEAKLSNANKMVAEVALRGAVRGLKLNVAPDATDSMRELLTMRAMAMPYRIQDGSVIFQKASDDGNSLIDINDPTTGRPVTMDKYVAEQFKTFLAPVETPAQGPNKTPAAANTNKPVPKDATEIAQQLIDEKFQIGSKAYNDELKARKTAYAIV